MVDQISCNNFLDDEDRTNHDILEANLISMLYCLRSKELFVDIARSVLKSQDRFEDIKVALCLTKKKVLEVDRISKNQNKKLIFNEISHNKLESAQRSKY